MFKIWMDGTLNYFVENQPGQKKKKKKKRHVKFCYLQSVYDKIGHWQEKKNNFD